MAITAQGGDDISMAYGPSGIKGLIREPHIVALGCLASVGGVLFGYDQGVISGILVMQSFVGALLYAQLALSGGISWQSLTDIEAFKQGKKFPTLANDATMQGWMVSVLVLGAMFGSFVNGPIADRFSRRWSLLVANIVFLIGSIIQAAAQNVPMIFVGRFIAGLAIGQLSMVVPLYLSELAPPNLRGSLVSLQQWGITTGILIAFWLDYGTQHIGGTGTGQNPVAWRLPLALQCVPSFCLAVGTFFLPYSPRWLVMKGRDEEALQALVRLRRCPVTDPKVQMELREIKVLTIFETESNETRFSVCKNSITRAMCQYAELFTTPHLRKRLVLASLLQILQQFSGINAIIYYAPTMFRSIGLTGNSVDLLATGVVGIINFFSTIPAILFIDQWGRRAVLMTGAVGMSIAQLIVGTLYAVYQNHWVEHKSAGWAAAVFIWVYIGNFAFSIGCVNWIMPSEIFPPAVRGKAVGFAIATNWLSNFIVALIVPRMLKSITFGTFYFFLAFCVLILVWVYWFVPETKGVGIEDMDKIFGGNQGEHDMQRIEEIRAALGGRGVSSEETIDPEKEVASERVEVPL